MFWFSYFYNALNLTSSEIYKNVNILIKSNIFVDNIPFKYFWLVEFLIFKCKFVAKILKTFN